jgi:hypothetical protein
MTDTSSPCQISISRCLTTLSPEDRHILFSYRVAAETLHGVQWRSYDLWNTVLCTVAQLRSVEHCMVYSGAATIVYTGVATPLMVYKIQKPSNPMFRQYQ